MIDWWFVVRNGLWIMGAAIVLASWSYHHWLAVTIATQRAEVFTRRAWVIASGAGGCCVCVGFATLSRSWPAIFWSFLALALALRTWRGMRNP